MSKCDRSKITLDEFPEAVQKQVKDFHDALAQLRDRLKPLAENYEEVEEKANGPLERAQLGYTTAYALNSLFWMYLITVGENPQEHDIKREIDKLKASGVRLREIAEKDKQIAAETDQRTVRVDTDAAKRFVTSALFEPSTSYATAAKRSRKS